MPKDGSGQVDNGSTAVVVLGHGSRAAGAADALAGIAGRLGRGLDYPVRAASLQFNHPTLAECCRELISEGASRIIVAPYFLFNGNHIRQDIPGEIEELNREFGEVEFVLARGLGDDGRLADILRQRVTEVAMDGDLSGNKAASSTPGVVMQAGRSGGAIPPATNSIEAESFSIIDSLLEPDVSDDPAYQVVRRVVHATGDPELAPDIRISPGAIEAALAALGTEAPIVCDVNMVASGIGPTAERMGMVVHCGVAGGDTAALAAEEGITRSAAAFRLFARGQEARPGVSPIVAIGNAPTALFECLSLEQQGLWRPSLVIGVPVGFVGAAESKQTLADSVLPHITIPGNRGGSSIAVAIVNALLKLEKEI